MAHAGVDPTFEDRAPQDALRATIATRGGYCWWDVDHVGWVVTLSSEEQTFYGRTLEEALAWNLVWLMVKGTGHPQGLDWDMRLASGRSEFEAAVNAAAPNRRSLNSDQRPWVSARGRSVCAPQITAVPELTSCLFPG